jgi:hypothetical protein
MEYLSVRRSGMRSRCLLVFACALLLIAPPSHAQLPPGEECDLDVLTNQGLWNATPGHWEVPAHTAEQCAYKLFDEQHARDVLQG